MPIIEVPGRPQHIGKLSLVSGAWPAVQGRDPALAVVGPEHPTPSTYSRNRSAWLPVWAKCNSSPTTRYGSNQSGSICASR